MTKKDQIKMRIGQLYAKMDVYICRYPMIDKIGKQIDALNEELKQYGQDEQQKGILPQMEGE